MRSLRVCLVASEVVPFAKTGGLADVAAALPAELAQAGHDARVFMPLYPRAAKRIREFGLPLETEMSFSTPCGGTRVETTLRISRLPGAEPDSPVPVCFIDCPELFDRDDLYTDDPDEHVRWGVFTRAVLESCQRLQWSPDLFHCNDWHTGLLPLLLKTEYAWDQLFESTKSLLTIHNIGYQGQFDAKAIDDLGIGEQRRFLDANDLDDGRINFLKTGIRWADALSTVSETYAREIQTEEFGAGLEGILRQRREALHGIVNGVDYSAWDPATDSDLWANYSAEDLSGKATNRRELLALFDLAPDPTGPVFGIVSRLTGQKGFEILPDALPIFLHRDDIRLVVLGSGEQSHERYFQWLRDAFPTKVAFYRGYDEPLAHRIEGGADVFLMPSRYEPCGLNQMYSLRYGTVPVVRGTGGLADTVERWDPEHRTGTGFVFYEFSSTAMCGVLDHVLEVYQDREAWSALQAAGMSRDFSWRRQAPHYVALYESLDDSSTSEPEVASGRTPS